MRYHQLLWGIVLVALVSLLSIGCSGTGTNPTAKKKEGQHAHPSKGPHGGPLAEWGDEVYHAELVLNREMKEASVYVLDGHVENAVPIEARTITLTVQGDGASTQVELKADPQATDPEGKSSRFTGKHEKFGEELDPEKINASAVIKGTPYQGHFHVEGGDPPMDEFKTGQP